LARSDARVLSSDELRARIIASLRRQGFRFQQGRILLPPRLDKCTLRALHAPAVRQKIAKAEKSLREHERRLLKRFASGKDLRPERIAPRLVEVRPGSEEELLFRYACLHWSVPVSSGYGRRLRFVVLDGQNDCLIGLIGLGDPVFSLAARDEWVGWDKATRRRRLRHVMDAFVLGAVPPYSHMLCGKLVALLVASDEVRAAFRRRYRGKKSVITEEQFDGRLALVTTTSALGRSSLYNRLTFKGRRVFQRVGYTRGSGEFHFSDGLYAAIKAYAEEHCCPTAKQKRWGTGFRNKREVVRKCLAALGLSREWVYHGIRREVFVVPLARNSREFLRGEHSRLLWHHQSVDELFHHFKKRWLLPRTRWDKTYRDFEPSDYALWNIEG